MNEELASPAGERRCEELAIAFTGGLPEGGGGPFVFILDDGSVHEGQLMWCTETGRRVLRTTNSAGGLHEVFDIAPSRVLGHAWAGPRWKIAV